ncbi:VOC family protein [Streptomyces pactum]|uniref:VOC family protein n=1 Tax=Streptomyces pactum TaxID=68249 RepID=A0ABS0NQB5_9ACTN|nr:VOC family protein [Streptomyces pactum]MBH5337390.1 VOC family protein [Streptomyces pactum]
MTEAPARCAPGTPCWTSLMVHSLAAGQHFYHELFGWDFAPGPQLLGSCVRGTLDGLAVAGIGELPAERRLPVAWTTYLASDDADETADRIRSRGGTVAVGPLDTERAGRMLIASDPAGAVFGVWQSPGHGGTESTGVPGTPAWHELVTYESAAVGAFYEAVFGHRARREPAASGPGRTTLYAGDRPVAAIRGRDSAAFRERGPHWLTYFEVADADAAARRVTELGGRVLRTPYEAPIGRCAEVTDPEGAVFTVVRRSG